MQMNEDRNCEHNSRKSSESSHGYSDNFIRSIYIYSDGVDKGSRSGVGFFFVLLLDITGKTVAVSLLHGY